MKELLFQLREKTDLAISKAQTLDDINKIRIDFLGKKGELTKILRGIGAMPPEERPVIGQLVNEIRAEIEEKIAQKSASIEEVIKANQLKAETIDVTVPGVVTPIGKKHPITQILDEIKTFFIGMGYSVAEGPEIELDYYNFEALNTPKDHPARDIQDTFYITQNILLRTQTSPVQMRVMEKQSPPVKIIAPGRVYRSDAVDATHSPMFHQVEGLYVDTGVTLGDLKGTLIEFARAMYGQDRGVRFRPHYFPFTEPSAEMDISCKVCSGKGCKACSYAGWIEILGCGMVHPRVLEMAGYDSECISGFAFGMGIERITMQKYGIDDMRLLYENNLKFLTQF